MAQALATTLVVASLYALLGAGYVLVYRASRVLNLAQGDLLTLGGYFLFATAATFPGAPVLALPLAAALSALTGVLVYVALMRPMAGHPVFAAVLVAGALGILLRAGIGLVFTDRPRPPLQKPRLSNPPRPLAGGAVVSTFDLVMVGAAVALFAALFVFLKVSPLGIRMRAAGERALLASQRGINFHGVFALSWALAAFAGGLAGMIYSSNVRLEPSLGILGLRAFAVALVGGLDRLGLRARPREPGGLRRDRRPRAERAHGTRGPDLARPRRLPRRRRLHHGRPRRARSRLAARDAAGDGARRRCARPRRRHPGAAAQGPLPGPGHAGHAPRRALRGRRDAGARRRQHGLHHPAAAPRRPRVQGHRGVVLRPRRARRPGPPPRGESAALARRPRVDGDPRPRRRRRVGRHRRRPLQALGLRLVERRHGARGRALRLPPRLRLGGGVRLLRCRRVHRHDHHRRPRLGPRRRAGGGLRDAAALRDRRARGRRQPRRRAVLRLSREVRGLRPADGPLPRLRAAGPRRHLAPRPQLVLPLAVPPPSATRVVLMGGPEMAPLIVQAKGATPPSDSPGQRSAAPRRSRGAPR